MSKDWKNWYYLVWRKLRGDLMIIFKYETGCYKENGNQLFSVSFKDRRRKKEGTYK